MKAKLFFSTMALAALMAATGCSDEEVVTSSAGNKEWEGTATIKGVLYINRDLTNKELEFPTAPKVFVTYNSGDLALNPSEKNFTKVVPVIYTPSNGNFTVNVPACNKAVTYTIHIEDIREEFVRPGEKETDSPIKRQAIFKNKAIEVSLIKGSTNEQRVDFGSDPESIMEDGKTIQ